MFMIQNESFIQMMSELRPTHRQCTKQEYLHYKIKKYHIIRNQLIEMLKKIFLNLVNLFEIYKCEV